MDTGSESDSDFSENVPVKKVGIKCLLQKIQGLQEADHPRSIFIYSETKSCPRANMASLGRRMSHVKTSISD